MQKLINFFVIKRFLIILKKSTKYPFILILNWHLSRFPLFELVLTNRSIKASILAFMSLQLCSEINMPRQKTTINQLFA